MSGDGKKGEGTEMMGGETQKERGVGV